MDDQPSPISIPAPPNWQRAQLPAIYQQAAATLARAESADECLRWNNQAAAIASYYRQAKDTDLINTARRIQLRAWRRLGEIMKVADSTLTPDYDNPAGGNPKAGGTLLAEAHKIDHHARHAARRLAEMPSQIFEQLVEQPSPPTIAQVRHGRMRKPSTLQSSAGQAPHERRVARCIHTLNRLLSAAPPNGLRLSPSIIAEAKALINKLAAL